MNVKDQKVFSNKIVFVFLLISLISSALISAVNIVHMKVHLVEYSRDSIKTMVQIAATSLDGDLLDTIGPEDMYSDLYNDIFDILDGFRASENVKYIYTMRKVGDEVQFIVDVDDYDIAAVGEPFPTYDEIEQAFSGKVTLDKQVSHDIWGNYYSAFAPVRNRAGKIVAIVGIDCSLESIENQVNSMTISVVILHVICAVVLGILSMIVARVMTHYTYEASHDYLTGVYNRQYASRIIEKTGSEKDSFGFILLDIDYFKEVNDTYGHQTGDRVLQILARILSSSCRDKDVVFRLGGDEFAVYLDGIADSQYLTGLLQHIQDTFVKEAGEICPQIPDTGLSCGCVIGKGKVSFEEICQQADKLLYQVKSAGKGDFKIDYFK